ncbi:helix-turn-helix domain-containing protein [Nonomuraea sp. MTCD27]|uniref:helix-turn-helix domain-containing protein n=1 Tax=Nonomuraea sp. MTCD27 TaxID=1676747 RepID=UPI0035BEFF8F
MGDTSTCTAKSVAARLGVSVGTVYQWLKTGDIEQHGYTGRKEGGRWVLTPIAAAAAEPAKPRPAAVKDRIREAYASIATPNAWDPEWCSIAKLRAQLAGLDRDLVDDTLRAMERAGEVYIAPEADQKMLTDADREAAIVIGGKPKHLFCIHG